MWLAGMEIYTAWEKSRKSAANYKGIIIFSIGKYSKDNNISLLQKIKNA
jgi:hypothetical protein